jgi:hypothetical protein
MPRPLLLLLPLLAAAAASPTSLACDTAASLLTSGCAPGAAGGALACCAPFRALATLGCACAPGPAASLDAALTLAVRATLQARCGVVDAGAELDAACDPDFTAPVDWPAASASSSSSDDEPFVALFAGVRDWAGALWERVTAPLPAAAADDPAFFPLGALFESDFDSSYDTFDDSREATPAEMLAAVSSAGGDAAFFRPVVAAPGADVVLDLDADADGGLTTAAVATTVGGGLTAALDVAYGAGPASARDTMQRLADWVSSLGDDLDSSSSRDALDDAAGVLEAVGDRLAAALADAPDAELSFDVAVDLGPSNAPGDARVDVHVASVDGRVPAAVLEAALAGAAADAAERAGPGVSLAASVSLDEATTTATISGCPAGGAAGWVCAHRDTLAAVLAVEAVGVALLALAAAVHALMATADEAPVVDEEEALIGTGFVASADGGGAARDPLWAVDAKA